MSNFILAHTFQPKYTYLLSYVGLMGTPVNIYEAKTHFSKLLERVTSGEEIILTRAGKSITRLSLITQKRTRTPGEDEGLTVLDSFFEPLPEDILKSLE